jgi:hypothetical protein
MAWTLVVYQRVWWALAGALVQLTVLLVGVSLAVAIPTLPLTWLGAAHTLAAAAGIGVWGLGLARNRIVHSWYAGLLVSGTAMGFFVGALLHHLTPGAATSRLAAAETVALVTLGVGMVIVLVFMPQEPLRAVLFGSQHSRLAKQRLAKQRERRG